MKTVTVNTVPINVEVDKHTSAQGISTLHAGGARLVKRHFSYNQRQWNKKTRLYVSIDQALATAINGAPAPKSYAGCPNKIKPIEGHDKTSCKLCINDAAWAAYNKAEIFVMKAEARRILKALGLKDLAFKYDAHAGCSCNCSPGFILDGVLTAEVDGKTVRIEQIS